MHENYHSFHVPSIVNVNYDQQFLNIEQQKNYHDLPHVVSSCPSQFRSHRCLSQYRRRRARGKQCPSSSLTLLQTIVLVAPPAEACLHLRGYEQLSTVPRSAARLPRSQIIKAVNEFSRKFSQYSVRRRQLCSGSISGNSLSVTVQYIINGIIIDFQTWKRQQAI